MLLSAKQKNITFFNSSQIDPRMGNGYVRCAVCVCTVYVTVLLALPLTFSAALSLFRFNGIPLYIRHIWINTIWLIGSYAYSGWYADMPHRRNQLNYSIPLGGVCVCVCLCHGLTLLRWKVTQMSLYLSPTQFHRTCAYCVELPVRLPGIFQRISIIIRYA